MSIFNDKMSFAERMAIRGEILKKGFESSVIMGGEDKAMAELEKQNSDFVKEYKKSKGIAAALVTGVAFAAVNTVDSLVNDAAVSPRAKVVGAVAGATAAYFTAKHVDVTKASRALVVGAAAGLAYNVAGSVTQKVTGLGDKKEGSLL